MKKIRDISKEQAIINNLVTLCEKHDRQRKIRVVSALVLAVTFFVIGMGLVLATIPGAVDTWLGL